MATLDALHLRDTALPIDRLDLDVSHYLAGAANPENYDIREKLEQWRADGIVVFEHPWVELNRTLPNCSP